MKKLSYASGTASEPLMGYCIGDAFDQTVEKYPLNEAVVSRHQKVRYTYLELQEKVNKCAKSFIKIDVQIGDRVGIWSPNCVEWLICQLATAKIGAILVCINPSYRLNELEYGLSQSGCSVLVTADQFKASNYTKMICELAPEAKQSKGNRFDCAKLPDLHRIISLAHEEKEGLLMWDDFVEFGTPVNDQQLTDIQSALNFDDAINIQYTSGTTGYPKGATLSHHNILNNGYLVSKMQRFTDKERLVIPVPLYHCFGMVLGNLGCICYGATMIYPSEGFDPEAVLAAIDEEKATALFGVPTMFYAELNHPNFDTYDMSSLRTGIMAGSVCPSELMRRVNKEMNMTEFEIAYGMTETSPASTQTRYDAPFEKRVTTVGTILPHTEIKLIEPNTDQVVPIGSIGELCTRGYCVMLGYWNDPEKTREAIDPARWMHTGDLAVMDQDGYVSIVGRIKDMIIRGGENVYPKEIEEFLSKHPDITAVEVVGIPDEKYGEEICAWVRLAANSTIDFQDIINFCEGQIAHYKIPRHIKFVDEFPMTVTGKVRKVEMRRISTEEIVS